MKILQKRSITTGGWVSISRQITAIFKRHQLSSFVEGLDTIDWGRPGDDGLIARIMDLEIDLLTVSFEAPVDLINAGYKDVDALIKQIPVPMETIVACSDNPWMENNYRRWSTG